jgi:hypothetical protein
MSPGHPPSSSNVLSKSDPISGKKAEPVACALAPAEMFQQSCPKNHE